MRIDPKQLSPAVQIRIAQAIAKEDRHANRNRATDPAADVESHIADAPVAEKKTPGLHSPCRCHFHSLRHRLADSDGISIKAALDGIVHAGILPDDSAKEIRRTSQSQQKTDGPERTIIVLDDTADPASGFDAE